MLFNSYVFIFLFLPICLTGFFVIGRRGQRRIALAWLVLCSLFYYAWWNPAYLGLLLFSILFNYGTGVYLGGREGTPRANKLVLAFGVAANLGLLGYYKYANFFIDTLGDLGAGSFHLETIILPLGISFFTFQQVAYLVDAYQGKTREHKFLDYCLFVSFFPQLIAGPIVHHKEMLPQFARPSNYRPRMDNLSIGVTIFTIGLFKKVMIADSVAGFANVMFDGAAAGTAPTFAGAWLGTLAYAFQIYFDFSGYSDMAIGLGRMFGIRLPLNFNSPYRANSIIDFWRRWHLTLSRFLRDYLYIPLGGSRHGKPRRYVNLMITMLLGGLWHRASWLLVFWGGLHGLFLVTNHLWRAARVKLGADLETQHWWGKAMGRSLTFFAVVVAWVFFRAEGLVSARSVLGAMFGENGFSLTASFDVETAGLWVLALIGLAGWAPSTQQIMARYRPALGYLAKKGVIAYDNSREPKLRWKPTTTWALLIAAMAILAIVNLTRVSEFIYWQF